MPNKRARGLSIKKLLLPTGLRDDEEKIDDDLVEIYNRNNVDKTFSATSSAI